MLKNYFKVAFRYLAKHKGYTAINVAGLTVGIMCCILIMLFVRSEWSYDRFHSKSDRLYRAWLKEHYEAQDFTNTVTPLPLAGALRTHIPEIESTCRVFSTNTLVKFGENSYNEVVHMVDSSFFQLFDFPLVDGNRQNPLINSQSLVISEKIAKKYFGKQSAIGKNLELTLGTDKLTFTVAAVARDVQQESSIRFDFLFPFSNDRYLFSERARTSGWQQVFVETYVLLKEGVTSQAASSKFEAMVKSIAGENYKPGEYNITLQPMTAIHLDKSLPSGIEPISDPKYSYILGTLGLLILFIACINFVTLSIGRSATRALEVGVRKVLGAERKQLIRQYWGESLILTLISLVVAILLAALLLKPFNQLAQRELVLQPDWFTIAATIVLVAIVAIISGIYPAIILSAFKPIEVLKGKLKTGTGIGMLRKVLIGGQFIASIVMITGTIVVSRQLNFMRNTDLGFDKESVVIIQTNKRRAEAMPLADRFRQQLSASREVISSSTSMFSLAEAGWANMGYTDDKKDFRQFRMNAVDEDFIPTMQLQVLKGRNFAKDNAADRQLSMIVNEAMVREYGWKDPIGQRLPGKYEHQVIGVVKDFHFESLHNQIAPMAFVLVPDSMFRRSSDVSIPTSTQPRITVRLKPGNLVSQMDELKATWTKAAPGQDFAFTFLDDALNTAYQQEQRLASMVRYASILSIFIACLGLFGMATLIVVRRTKEIGIRKVLGAEVSTIVMLLSKDFVWLVLISALIAFPLAWWALSQWLQDFAYRINLPWWAFILSAVAALLVALVTVSIQALKAAFSNPVKSLRSE